jgi:hypothetical protein
MIWMGARDWLAQEGSTAPPRQSWTSLGVRFAAFGGLLAGAVALRDVYVTWDCRITIVERLQLAAQRVSE